MAAPDRGRWGIRRSGRWSAAHQRSRGSHRPVTASDRDYYASGRNRPLGAWSAASARGRGYRRRSVCGTVVHKLGEITYVRVTSFQRPHVSGDDRSRVARVAQAALVTLVSLDVVLVMPQDLRRQAIACSALVAEKMSAGGSASHFQLGKPLPGGGGDCMSQLYVPDPGCFVPASLESLLLAGARCLEVDRRV
jgi:hypothetical protein